MRCCFDDMVVVAFVDAGELACCIMVDGVLCGVFCGMGVCHDCFVEVDGEFGCWVCMMFVREGMYIEL